MLPPIRPSVRHPRAPLLQRAARARPACRTRPPASARRSSSLRGRHPAGRGLRAAPAAIAQWSSPTGAASVRSARRPGAFERRLICSRHGAGTGCSVSWSDTPPGRSRFRAGQGERAIAGRSHRNRRRGPRSSRRRRPRLAAAGPGFGRSWWNCSTRSPDRVPTGPRHPTAPKGILGPPGTVSGPPGVIETRVVEAVTAVHDDPTMVSVSMGLRVRGNGPQQREHRGNDHELCDLLNSACHGDLRAGWRHRPERNGCAAAQAAATQDSSDCVSGTYASSEKTRETPMSAGGDTWCLSDRSQEFAARAGRATGSPHQCISPRAPAGRLRSFGGVWSLRTGGHQQWRLRVRRL